MQKRAHFLSTVRRIGVSVTWWRMFVAVPNAWKYNSPGVVGRRLVQGSSFSHRRTRSNWTHRRYSCAVCLKIARTIEIKLKQNWNKTEIKQFQNGFVSAKSKCYAKIDVKRFIWFSESQPVSAHVIVPPQSLAWRANSWWRLGLTKIAKTFHGRSVLFWLKRDRLKTVWNCFSFISFCGQFDVTYPLYYHFFPHARLRCGFLRL